MQTTQKISLVITASADQVAGAARKTATALRQGFDKSRTAAKAFNDTVGNGQRALSGLSSGMKTLLAGAGMQQFASRLFDAGVAAQQIDRAFVAVKGSAAAAESELAFLRATSERLGLEFYSTANAFKGILAAAEGTALQGEQVRRIFTGITEASAALGLSSEETSGALQALSQMISKGNVQAEELRGQLGERLPGAFQLAARAMGVSTQELNKMLEQGQVLATDLLPKLADVLHEKYGRAAAEASGDAVKAFNRFQTAWKDLKAQVAQSGFMDAAAATFNRLAQAFKDPELVGSLRKLGERFGRIIQGTVEAAIEWRRFLAALLGTVVAVKAVVGLTKAILGLQAAFIALTGTGFLAWIVSVRAAVAALAVQAGVAGMAMKAGLAAGAVYGAVKIVELVRGVIYQWRKAAAEAEAAHDRLRENTQRVLDKFKALLQ